MWVFRLNCRNTFVSQNDVFEYMFGAMKMKFIKRLAELIFLLLVGFAVSFIMSSLGLSSKLVVNEKPSIHNESASNAPTIDAMQLRASLVPLTYDDIARYPDENNGKSVLYRGKIVQKIGVSALRVNITQDEYGLWSDTVYVDLKGAAKDVRLLEEDIIELLGITNGDHTYRTIFGHLVTIPKITAYEITILAKKGEPWPPKVISREEAVNIVLNSNTYKTSYEKYAAWWNERYGTSLDNVSVEVSNGLIYDGINGWWVTTINNDGDPDVRTQEIISSYGVDKLTGKIYIYNNAEGFVMPID